MNTFFFLQLINLHHLRALNTQFWTFIIFIFTNYNCSLPYLLHSSSERGKIRGIWGRRRDLGPMDDASWRSTIQHTRCSFYTAIQQQFVPSTGVILYHIILHSVILYGFILYYMISYYITFCHIIRFYTILYYTIWYHIISHYTILYCVTLYFTVVSS